MSYPTHVTGRISITPPLTHADLRDVPHLTRCKVDKNNVTTWRQAWIDVDEHATETDQGTLLAREGRYIRAYDEEQSPYHLNENVQEIVDTFPDREYGGHLECFCGDDNGDTWRVVVRNKQVKEIKPTMTWPDD